MKRTYVFINRTNPQRIKMIQARGDVQAYNKLDERLNRENISGVISDYCFGYFM